MGSLRLFIEIENKALFLFVENNLVILLVKYFLEFINTVKYT